MNENGSNGGNGGGDSDSSLNGDAKLCRDFIRNVCNRGKNCKFIHPENIKIRTDPIFCHDYQQGKCFRSTCKFVHCTRDDEEHYKQTGEMPTNMNTNAEAIGYMEMFEQRPRKAANANIRNKSARGGNSGGRNGPNHGSSGYSNGGGVNDYEGTPVCKDFLKGICDRPPGGCKFRHMSQIVEPSSRGGGGYGGHVRGGSMGNARRGGAGGMSIARRRPGNPNYYDAGPEPKRNYHGAEALYHEAEEEEYEEDDEEDYYNAHSQGGYSAAPPPPPPQTYQSSSHVRAPQSLLHHPSGPSHSHGAGHGHGVGLIAGHPHGAGYSHAYHQAASSSASYTAGGSNRNGYNAGLSGHGYSGVGNEPLHPITAYFQSTHSADAMKALEDENFMLKRRIEELKTSNEFLLGQNAQLRLNNSLSVNRTSVGVENVQVQQGVAGGGSVVQTLVSMAQPMGMTPSLSVAATQPMSTMSTMPTVSLAPVSISQALPVVSIAQHQPQPQTVYPMVTSQGVLPPPN